MNILTLQDLKDMEPSSIFATGTAIDSPEGINMSNSGEGLCWIAVRGDTYDWCIYVGLDDKPLRFVKMHGDKLCVEEYIKRLISCTDEAFNAYRY